MCLNNVLPFIHSFTQQSLIDCDVPGIVAGSEETRGTWRHWPVSSTITVLTSQPQTGHVSAGLAFQSQACLCFTSTPSFPGSGLSPWRLTLKPLPGLSPLTPRSHDEGVIFPPIAAKAKAGHCILGWRHQSLGGKISWKGEQVWDGVIRLGDPGYDIIKRCEGRPGAMLPLKYSLYFSSAFQPATATAPE